MFQDYLGFFLPPKSFLTCTVPSVERSCSRTFIHLEKAALHEFFFSFHLTSTISRISCENPTSSHLRRRGAESESTATGDMENTTHTHIHDDNADVFHAKINKTHHTAEAKADAASSQVKSPKRKSSTTSKQDGAATASPVGKSAEIYHRRRKGW